MRAGICRVSALYRDGVVMAFNTRRHVAGAWRCTPMSCGPAGAAGHQAAIGIAVSLRCGTA